MTGKHYTVHKIKSPFRSSHDGPQMMIVQHDMERPKLTGPHKEMIAGVGERQFHRVQYGPGATSLVISVGKDGGGKEYTEVTGHDIEGGKGAAFFGEPNQDLSHHTQRDVAIQTALDQMQKKWRLGNKDIELMRVQLLEGAGLLGWKK